MSTAVFLIISALLWSLVPVCQAYCYCYYYYINKYIDDSVTSGQRGADQSIPRHGPGVDYNLDQSPLSACL